MKAFGGKRCDGQGIHIGKRERPRSNVSLPGNLATTARHQSVVLADVSTKGAKVCGPNLPSSGEFVRLTIANSTAFCEVVWSEGEEAGLVFDDRLSDAELLEFRQAALEAQRLGLSPDMVRARADWSNGR